MRKSMDRRWNYLTLDQIREMTKSVTPENVWIEDPTSFQYANSDLLAGKTLRFELDGLTLDYEFLDKSHLVWRENGGEAKEDGYRAVTCPGHDELVFIVHYIAGLELPRCLNIVFDRETGLAVVTDASAGLPANPREVTRTIHFGKIAGIETPANAFRPCLTTELVGKAVYWSSTGYHDPKIKYIFCAPNYYTYAVRVGTDYYWMATNPCEYIKIKENVYLMSLIEARQAGYLLHTLMNLDMMRDLQSGFGVGTGGPPEAPDRVEAFLRQGRYGGYTTPDTIWD